MRPEILVGDCRDVLKTLPEESVHCVCTSPPYWGLRDYGHPEQIGMEKTPAEYVDALVEVFREVRRVLHPSGVVWLNLGDTYASGTKGSGGQGKSGLRRDGRDEASRIRSADLSISHQKFESRKLNHGLKEKDLVGIPWRVALALQADGWWLRSEVIWSKPNGLPSSADDRPTRTHEHVFMLTKAAYYFYDADAIREPHAQDSLARLGRGRSAGHKWQDGPGDQTIANDLSRACHPNGRNKRSVWTIPTKPYSGAHFATMPPALARPCILSGTSEAGACPTCLAPWEPIVEKGEPNREWQARCGADRSGGYNGQATKDYKDARAQDPSAVKARILAGMRERRTVGWRPTCDCPEHQPVPCTVLDPFGGSGTTGLVATELSRRAILIEINPEYADQAEERTAQSSLELLAVG